MLVFSFEPMFPCKQVSADISPGRYGGPVNETWHLPPLPDINEVSQRFAELASNLGRQLANLVGMFLQDSRISSTELYIFVKTLILEFCNPGKL